MEYAYSCINGGETTEYYSKFFRPKKIMTNIMKVPKIRLFLYSIRLSRIRLIGGNKLSCRKTTFGLEHPEQRKAIDG
jgi:hypothetical protein